MIAEQRPTIRIENYPELAAGVNRHLSETRRQKERLEQCLNRQGTVSRMKDVAAKFTAMMPGVGGSMVGRRGREGRKGEIDN